MHTTNGASEYTEISLGLRVNLAQWAEGCRESVVVMYAAVLDDPACEEIAAELEASIVEMFAAHAHLLSGSLL